MLISLISCWRKWSICVLPICFVVRFSLRKRFFEIMRKVIHKLVNLCTLIVMMREIERKKLGLKTTTNKICWNMLYISYLHVEWKPKICNGCNVRSGLLLSCFFCFIWRVSYYYSSLRYPILLINPSVLPLIY